MLPRTLAFASAVLLCAQLFASPGHATTRYVAANATGVSPCGASAPCSSIALAMSAASVGDTIVCLSPPVGDAVRITKSITIDCSGTRAPMRDRANLGSGDAYTGIIINIAVSSTDPLRTVRLRGLTVDGASTDTSGRFLDRGIDIQAAAAVFIEDCVISNVNQQGIYDHRSGGQTKLFITDSFISGAGGAGIVAASAAVGITVLDNVRSEYNAYGIAAATGNNVLINRSVFSGNSTAGVIGDSGAQIAVNNSTISHNNIGVQSVGSVRLSNNEIAFNTFAISGPAGTFGNNRFSGNPSHGTAPTPLGAATSDLAQQ